MGTGGIRHPSLRGHVLIDSRMHRPWTFNNGHCELTSSSRGDCSVLCCSDSASDGCDCGADEVTSCIGAEAEAESGSARHEHEIRGIKGSL